jgi:hypothetical protein
LLFEYEERLVGTKKATLDDFARGQTTDRKAIDKVKLELAARRTLDTLDEMEEVFLPNDDLLNSAGLFPVYYWLVRSINPIFHDDIRPFIVWFENERKQHREAQKDLGPAADVDQQFARYDTLNRSTNDAISHRGRFEILKTSFQDYIEEKYGLGLEVFRSM